MKTCPFCLWSTEPVLDPSAPYRIPVEFALNEAGAHTECARKLGPLASHGYIILPTFDFQIVKATAARMDIARAFRGVAIAEANTRYPLCTNVRDPVKWAEHELGKRAAKRLYQETKRSVTEWKVWRVA